MEVKWLDGKINCKICNVEVYERSILYIEKFNIFVCNGCYGNYDDKELEELLKK